MEFDYGVGEGVGKELTMETDNMPPNHHQTVRHASSIGRIFTWIQAWVPPARLASRNDPDSTKTKKALGQQNNSMCNVSLVCLMCVP